jgi:CDGSH-type Zn-finger protein
VTHDVREIRVRACPDGPLLVRGADAVVDEAGVPHEVTRPVVAVCVCGRSSRAPWCDGTHQAGEARRARDGAAGGPDEPGEAGDA